ncbi:hypothetical protein ACKI1J_38670 [Streptomyces scabiei]|uniref:hypothetical protein n=1 Tax=Streptomyces scabiei TaxID=1930 RepID=UPI0039EF7EB1
MTMPEATVAVELERLRGTVETGFARTDGQLALLVQRGDQTDRKIDDHETRLDALERNRWPLPAVATLTSLCALVVTLWQATAR